MDLIKSLFVTTHIMLALVASVVAGWHLSQLGLMSPWLGTLLAALPQVLFFTRLTIAPKARTSANLYDLLVCGLVGTALAAYLAGSALHPAVIWAALSGLVSATLYTFWYSHFDRTQNRREMRAGAVLKDFPLFDLDGKALRSSQFYAKPALWIFFRGNWCPLCSAQVAEIAAQYRELQGRGIQVFVISPQNESHSRALAARFDAPMNFMQDRDNTAAKSLSILHPRGLPYGMQVLGYEPDVPMPTVILTAAGGRIIYSDCTDNYRVRPEPRQFLEAFDRAPAGAVPAIS